LDLNIFKSYYNRLEYCVIPSIMHTNYHNQGDKR
jgi:hypothetical protein